MQASSGLSHWHLPPPSLFSLSCHLFSWASLPPLSVSLPVPSVSPPPPPSFPLRTNQGVALGGALVWCNWIWWWLQRWVRTRRLFEVWNMIWDRETTNRKVCAQVEPGRDHDETLHTCLLSVGMWWLTGGSNCLWLYHLLYYRTPMLGTWIPGGQLWNSVSQYENKPVWAHRPFYKTSGPNVFQKSRYSLC